MAFAVKLHSEVIANHSALILFNEGSFKAFHYNHPDVLFEEIEEHNDWVILNIFGRIPSDLVSAFANLCRVVSEEANPEYGYAYDGSFHDLDGSYKSATGSPQILTCVGICLSVLKGFFVNLDKLSVLTNLIKFEDWDNSEVPDWYLNRFSVVAARNPDTPPEVLWRNLRRIRPSEFLTIPLFEEFPVSKASVDEVIEHVETVLRERLPEPQEEI